MAFPFKQHWFNLHTMPSQHYLGMFTRQSHVPAYTKVVPGMRNPNSQTTTGYATTHREKTHVIPGTRNPVNTRQATGFAGTDNR